jgi:hypothetical protein
MAEWSKDHVVAIGHLNSILWFNCWNLIKLGTGRAIRGKRRQLDGNVRQWVHDKPAPPRLYPPPVSIKDRSVGPREQVLNVSIACW